MRLLDTPVRTAIADKLRGHVILNTESVPIFSRIVTAPHPDTYINIHNQSNTNGSDKQYFSIDHTVAIEVVHVWADEDDADVIDELTNQQHASDQYNIKQGCGQLEIYRFYGG